METLFIYGIIAIVVLSGIGALIYFGVLDLGSYLPDKCSIDSIDVTCPQGEWQFEAGDSPVLGITANSKPIVIPTTEGGANVFIMLNQTQDIQVFTFSGAASAGCAYEVAVDGAGTDISIPADKVTPIDFANADGGAGCVISDTYKGQKLKFDIEFRYRPAGAAISQKAVGEITVSIK